MHDNAHGGHLQNMAAIAGRPAAELLDFSVNVCPEGAPAPVRAAMFKAMNNLEAYPSPHAEELTLAASRFHGLEPDSIVFGNGSNELIHAMLRVLAKHNTPHIYIVEPAFSEYALAATRENLPLSRIWQGAGKGADSPELPVPHKAIPFEHIVQGTAPLMPQSVVFLANPANPSGQALPAKELCHIMALYPNTLWVIDEAFIDYVMDADASLLCSPLPKNAIVLRSLTKFYALPGIRLGYLVGPIAFVQAVQKQLPAWNINALAMAAALTIFTGKDMAQAASIIQEKNAKRKEQLLTKLAHIPGVRTIPSQANYVLFRWPVPVPNLYTALLQNFGIAIRDCSNYYGLDDNTWFRVAVRPQKDQERLLDALGSFLGKAPAALKQTPALMLQGTSSDAGKSILAAAFCRIFQQDGYRVAPFKAQNMSLHSGVTLLGEEMGRAQIVQAKAACIDPDARMNPVLLKPHSDTGSQVIVCGKAVGHMDVHTYFAYKKNLWDTVTKAYDALAQDYDIMVLEGAGSPGEINLKEHDIVNMRMAEHANAAVLLVGDIDRGGVYASFLGTWMTFSPNERRLLAGYIVNKFRGNASLLGPAHDAMLAHTDVAVLGVIPHMNRLDIPDEDMAGFFRQNTMDMGPTPDNVLDIAVVMLQHVSNYTDMTPLAAEPFVRLRPVRHAEEWGAPHVVIIPGSKSVVNDLAHLRAVGLADCIVRHAHDNKWVLGICGGLQMMGRAIHDPYGIESANPHVDGLQLMDLCSSFAKAKTLIHVPFVQTPLAIPTKGYEIHHGVTEHGPTALPLFMRTNEEGDEVCGYVTGRRWATYVHGLFDDDAFRHAWINHVRTDLALEPVPQGTQGARYDLDQALDRLADVVRNSIDMPALYARLGL